MEITLEKVLSFMKILDAFQNVERVLVFSKRTLPENDVEHSYFLTMLVWYVCQNTNRSLDTIKALQYALVHDLVEIYAGDTDVFSSDRKTKKEREQKAQQQLREVLPDFPDIHILVEHYEAQTDEESKLVYAFDKLMPLIQIYLDGGKVWKERNISLEMEKNI